MNENEGLLENQEVKKRTNKLMSFRKKNKRKKRKKKGEKERELYVEE